MMGMDGEQICLFLSSPTRARLVAPGTRNCGDSFYLFRISWRELQVAAAIITFEASEFIPAFVEQSFKRESTRIETVASSPRHYTFGFFIRTISDRCDCRLLVHFIGKSMVPKVLLD